MKKRKQCLNCKYGDIIRYARNDNRWPMGCFCERVEIPDDADCRDYINETWHKCSMWEAKAPKENAE